MPLLNIVGPQVKAARMKNDPPMTQEQLAIRLQLLNWPIDRFGVSKIERGERQVTDKEVLLLAEALSVSMAYLFEEDGGDAH